MGEVVAAPSLSCVPVAQGLKSSNCTDLKKLDLDRRWDWLVVTAAATWVQVRLERQEVGIRRGEGGAFELVRYPVSGQLEKEGRLPWPHLSPQWRIAMASIVQLAVEMKYRLVVKGLNISILHSHKFLEFHRIFDLLTIDRFFGVIWSLPALALAHPGISEWAPGDGDNTAAFEELIEEETRAVRGFPVASTITSKSISRSPKYPLRSSCRAESKRRSVQRWANQLLGFRQSLASWVKISLMFAPDPLDDLIFNQLLAHCSFFTVHYSEEIAEHSAAPRARPTRLALVTKKSTVDTHSSSTPEESSPTCQRATTQAQPSPRFATQWLGNMTWSCTMLHCRCREHRACK